ncbi:NAD(P)HX epimerase / NAD(P)HX dehydratase [invertebrate metagenome]|uniref:Nicotinamide nucleotide repair protein n=1 Tax=invertebrate metagenome TaxID=1711999 RepID=A0A484HBH2_9ZZZZ
MKSSLLTAAVLTVAEMSQADKAATTMGIPGLRLMEAAGFAIAKAVCRRHKQPVAILCGPGNNGGDGFVAARWLARAGWVVHLSLLGRRESLRGDAAAAAALWRGAVAPLSINSLCGCTLVIDALFGAGLARPLEGAARAVVKTINHRKLPVVAVDIPSGLHGDTGKALGDCALQADVTVTFFRPKPAHLLLPGRSLCGTLVVADIGIPNAVLDSIGPQIFINGPHLWPLPRSTPSDHKYQRGHVIAVGGAVMTGAVRLATRAARRVGVGLLTIAAPQAALSLYAMDAPGVIVVPCDRADNLATLLADARRNAVLIGPGAGRSAETRAAVTTVLDSTRPCVLDADALTSFSDNPAALFAGLHASCVLTPHDGEYTALFGEQACSRLERARIAARLTGAVVLLKGSDTVIAAPNGLAVINTNAPPMLATAGAGDVLAGLIVGLLAQGMDPFAAACAAAWLHGAAAARVGLGLIAEDLPEALPTVLAALAAG